MGRCQAAGEKKKEGGGAPYQKNTIFWLSCWRGPREPKKSAIVLIFRTAKNLSAEGERHGTSHQLQQPIRRQRDAPPHTPYPRLHGFIHTPPPQPRTKTSRATRKRPPMSSVPISISGPVVEYIVTIDVTRVRFPADASLPYPAFMHTYFGKKTKPRSKNPQLQAITLRSTKTLRGQELNPGLPRDGRKYLPLYYHGSA